MRLENKVILVADSSEGIGWEIVQACAREGGIVYMAVRDQPYGGELAQALTSKGMWVKSVYMDMRREETIRAAAELAATEEGRLDVLINHFGAAHTPQDRDFLHTSFDDFMGILRRNLAGVYLTCQAALEPMHASGGGSILNISAINGRYPGHVGYEITRAAVSCLTREIAMTYAHNNIRCNAILPGMGEHDAFRGGVSLHTGGRVLPGEMGTPREIAEAAVYLASDESIYTTGQLIETGSRYGRTGPGSGAAGGRGWVM